MVHQGRTANCPGAVGVQHGPDLPECCHLAHGTRVRLASNSAGVGCGAIHSWICFSVDESQLDTYDTCSRSLCSELVSGILFFP